MKQKKYIYFNNAATSHPKPESVYKSITDIYQTVPFEDYRGNTGEKAIDIMTDARKNIADFFNIKKYERIIFTQNSTESLNLALMGIARKYKKTSKKKLRVLTTNTEHNSVYRPLNYLKENRLIDFKIIISDKDGNISIDEIKKNIDDTIDLVVVNHCSNVTGKFIDIKKIGRICKQKKVWFLVDASQSAGIKKIDVNENNIDLLACTGHKNLFGMSGSGFLYIGDSVEIEPLKVGGTGIMSQLLKQPDNPFYLRYECGTPNHLAINSLNEGIKFINEKGVENIYKTKNQLANYFVEKLKKIDTVTIYGGNDYSDREAIVSFNIKGWQAGDIAYILGKSYNIICRSGLHCAPLIHFSLGTQDYGTVRISFSIFNTLSEIDILLDAIKKMVKAQ